MGVRDHNVITFTLLHSAALMRSERATFWGLEEADFQRQVAS